MDLKALWQQQPATPPPDIKEIFARITKMKRKATNKLLLTNVLLLATCIFIVAIGYSYHPKMVTTTLGIALMVVAMVIYLMVYNSMIPILVKSNIEANTHEYLGQLIMLKQKQDFLFKTMLSIYYVLLSVGMFLYFIEVTAAMTLLQKILTYGLTGAWFLFGWFYIKPRTVKKQQAELIALIDKLKEVDEQFTQ